MSYWLVVVVVGGDEVRDRGVLKCVPEHVMPSTWLRDDERVEQNQFTPPLPLVPCRRLPLPSFDVQK